MIEQVGIMSALSNEQEKRHYYRVSFIHQAKISRGGKDWDCRLLDISLKGVLIEPPDSFNIEKEDLYSINLTLSEDAQIDMKAKLIHTEENHLGFKWVDIDLDSLTTLRRLLEFNLNDADEINRELADLVSTKSQ